MIIIYDFDGTLTPYPFSNYEIIKKCTEIDREYRYKNMEELKEKIKDSFKEIKYSN